jgi:hypothetical protein
LAVSTISLIVHKGDWEHTPAARPSDWPFITKLASQPFRRGVSILAHSGTFTAEAK